MSLIPCNEPYCHVDRDEHYLILTCLHLSIDSTLELNHRGFGSINATSFFHILNLEKIVTAYSVHNSFFNLFNKKLKDTLKRLFYSNNF